MLRFAYLSASLGKKLASGASLFHHEVYVKLVAADIIESVGIRSELIQILCDPFRRSRGLETIVEISMGFLAIFALLDLGFPVSTGEEHVAFILCMRLFVFIFRYIFIGDFFNDCWY